MWIWVHCVICIIGVSLQAYHEKKVIARNCKDNIYIINTTMVSHLHLYLLDYLSNVPNINFTSVQCYAFSRSQKVFHLSGKKWEKYIILVFILHFIFCLVLCHTRQEINEKVFPRKISWSLSFQRKIFETVNFCRMIS